MIPHWIRPQRWQRAAFVGFALASIATYFYWAVLALPAGAGPSDFLHYYRGAQKILIAQSPFPDLYDYPLLVGFLAAPLARLDYLTARLVWYFFSHLSILAAAWLVWRALGRDRVAAGCVLAVWAFGGAVPETVGLGQVSPLLLPLLAVAYTQPGFQRGTAIGLGFSLKFLPAVLAVPLLLNREKRALCGVAAAAAIFLVVPWLLVAAAFSGPKAPTRTDYLMGTPAILNWSLPAFILRAFDPPQRGGAVPHDWIYGNDAANLHLSRERRLLSLATAILTFACGLLLLVKLAPASFSREQSALAMAGLISLTLAASPISWTHYQILQYPGFALLLSRVWRMRPRMQTAGLVLLGACLYQLPVAVLRAYYYRHGGWTADSPETLYFFTALTPVCCLIFFAWCLKELTIKTV